MPKNLKPLDQLMVVSSEQIPNARSAPFHCTHQSIRHVADINQVQFTVKISRNLALTERNRKTGWRRLISIPRSDRQCGTAHNDWGASFGYARLATVTATSPTRLLVLTNADLLVLMDEIPSMAAQVSRAARDRLQGL